MGRSVSTPSIGIIIDHRDVVEIEDGNDYINIPEIRGWGELPAIRISPRAAVGMAGRILDSSHVDLPRGRHE